MSETIQLEHVVDGEAFRALGTEWDALLAASPSDSIFLRHAWLSAWWETFGRDFELDLLLVRSAEGTLLGAAPLMIGRGPGRLRGRLRHLMFVGQRGETLAEHLDVVVRRDASPAVIDRLAEGMLDEIGPWDVLLLERVPAASPTLSRLEEALRERGVETERVRPQASPYLPLPASWDELLASKSRNFRRQWKNSYNRLAAEGEMRLLLAGRDLPVEEAFERLVELHRARWGEGAGSFRTERYLAFHRRLSRSMADADDLLLALLAVGERTVAARYDFVSAGKVWCFQGGWLPEYERMRAGTVLTGLVLAWAMEQGHREYDFLSGEDAYKRRWATEERTLVDLEAFTDSRRARWYQRASRVRNAVRGQRSD